MIKQLYTDNVSIDSIDILKPNECFVFGSNLNGYHGKGAALTAYQKFGAKYGVGVGPAGQCYAIPTKGYDMETLPLDIIAQHIDEFIEYAMDHRLVTFMVTSIGTGLAGYSPLDIAPLFLKHELPPNVYLPQSFWDIYTGLINQN